MKPISMLGPDIMQMQKNFNENRNVAIRKAAIQTGSSLIMNTPRDTGHARSNWLPSLNNPILSEIDAKDYGGDATVSKLKAEAGKFSSNDKSIHLTNNVPYINKLNQGHSDQQEDFGWMERIIEATIIQLPDDFLLKPPKKV